MKKLSLFALAAAGLFLGACSNDDAVKEVVKANDFTDGAFIGVSIQMPSANANTRANEDFNDGVASEYAVKDATLYIFKGASEAAAKYVGEYQIGTSFEMDGGANVTSTMQEATQISNELADEITKAKDNDAVNYYGYVILNNNGVDVVCDENTTFAQFMVREWTNIGTPVGEGADPTADGAFPNGLLMTNSPVSAEAGGAAAAPVTADNYTTLVKLDKSKIYATRADAISNPAGCIYVERAAAKVSVEVASSVTKVGEGDGAPSIVFDRWQIVNFPKTYYNTRQVDPVWGDYASYINTKTDITTTDFTNWKAANAYRFVSGTAFAPVVNAAHTDQPYRTYFAKDPTYNKDVLLERPQAVADSWITIESGMPGYTIENTFDVERQKWGNTTQVCFEATINGGNSFYTLNGGDTFVADPETTVTGYVSGLPAVKKALQDAIDNLVAADEAAWTGPGDGVFGYDASVAVTFKNAITETTPSSDNVELQAAYTITPKSGTNSTATAALTADDTAIKAALAAALPNYVVSYHKGGKTYYNARIQHFGDYETPWSITKPYQTQIPGTTQEQIYGVETNQTLAYNRFLGRYGVVRDNWYKLSVDKVMHIGSAEPIDLSSDGNKIIPDDQIENYIAVHVHIIPWVLRNQSVSF
ncbi:MAG: Mfa1 fimbrilin C-terminal domain-containing protein [Prevotella sp.]|nr:Mfa1 fimbrilin C-terminal domain-containing protein [Prevotella sp.]MBR3479822.1 Mfa1 fimbrilin C-terminal domain-containing protein [Prevotella sp.]